MTSKIKAQAIAQGKIAPEKEFTIDDFVSYEVKIAQQQFELAKNAVDTLKAKDYDKALLKVKAVIKFFEIPLKALYPQANIVKADIPEKEKSKAPMLYEYTDKKGKLKQWNGHGKTPDPISESGKDKSEFLIVKRLQAPAITDAILTESPAPTEDKKKP